MKNIAECMLALVILCGGIWIGFDEANRGWESWALDNGYAHYDQRTGELILHEKGGE